MISGQGWMILYMRAGKRECLLCFRIFVGFEVKGC